MRYVFNLYCIDVVMQMTWNFNCLFISVLNGNDRTKREQVPFPAKEAKLKSRTYINRCQIRVGSKIAENDKELPYKSHLEFKHVFTL